uniref:Peptidase S1 domain-containing protein n=1 Tax=Globodera rostochiensis TaxID=31243 RepID=A0A914HM69_GLORO
MAILLSLYLMTTLVVFCWSKNVQDKYLLCFHDSKTQFDESLMNATAEVGCSFLVLSKLAQLSREGFSNGTGIMLDENLFRLSAKSGTKLLIGIESKLDTFRYLPSPITADEPGETFVRDTVLALRQMQGPNNFTENKEPLFAGLYFDESFTACKKLCITNNRIALEWIGQLREKFDRRIFPFFALALRPDFVIGSLVGPDTLPPNAHELFDFFDLQLDTVRTDTETWFPRPDMEEKKYLNPFFAPTKKSFLKSIVFQADKLTDYGILNRTIVTFSVAKEYSFDYYWWPKRLSSAQICKSLQTQQPVFYDRNTYTVFMRNRKSLVPFNMPFHLSLKKKVKLCISSGFVGIGIESLTQDFDPELECAKVTAAKTALPLHESVGIFLPKKRSDKEHLQLKFSSNSSKTADPQHLDGHIHQKQLPNNSNVNDHTFWDIEKFYKNQSVAIRHRRRRQSDQSPNCFNLCGQPDPDLLTASQSRTYGGFAVNDNSYPWVTFVEVEVRCVRHQPSIMIHCTGVLITFQHVLSAAHCFFTDTESVNNCLGMQGRRQEHKYTRLSKDSVRIFHGSSEPGRAEASRVRSLYIPEQFDMSNEVTLRQYDYAVLKLTHLLDREDKVVPICLLNNKENEYMGESAVMVGFGSPFSLSPDLHKQVFSAIPIKLRSPDYCSNVYGDKLKWGYYSPYFICAGEIGRHITKGDCGGPLSIEVNGLHYLVGIAQTTNDYVTPQQKYIFPDIYTRVSMYHLDIAISVGDENIFMSTPYNKEQLKTCDPVFSKLLIDKYKDTCIDVAVDAGSLGACIPNILPAHNDYFTGVVVALVLRKSCLDNKQTDAIAAGLKTQLRIAENAAFLALRIGDFCAIWIRNSF